MSGFREREWRLMLDPAIIFFIAGVLGWQAAFRGHRERLALTGFLVSLLALVTMLAGNLIEFRIGELLYENVAGQWEPTDHLGWSIMGGGFMLLPFGMLLWGIACVGSRAASAWRRATPLVFGLLMLLLFVQVFVVLLLTHDPVQKGWMIVPMFIFGLSWIVRGYALWSTETA